MPLKNGKLQVDDYTDIVIENVGEGTDTIQTGITYTLSDTLENLILTGTAAVNGTGNVLNNALNGNGAANILDAGDGDDYLNGGAGADTMLGGLGNDNYIVDDSADIVIENTDEGTDFVQSSISYALSVNLEYLTLTGANAIDGIGNVLDNRLIGNNSANILTGGAGNDTLIGNEGADMMFGGLGDDFLTGGVGDDTMIGDSGNDTYIVDVSTDIITENVNEGIDSVQSYISYTLGANIENLTLGGYSNINGIGNELDNILIGNTFANVLNGGGGTDTMRGGNRDDTYIVDDSTDIVIENANEGTDTVQSRITYSLGANVENLTLTGSSANNGTGNALNNVLIGNNAANTLTGGGGNDTYMVDNVGDMIIENVNEGIDTVQSSVAYTLSSNVENLTLTGTTAINGTGNELNNVLIGNSSNNILSGGIGIDTLRGCQGDDIYMDVDSTDVITEFASEGIDTVVSNIDYTLATNIENLTLTGNSAINGTGNTLDNVLIGNSNANILTGGVGNDILDGGAGTDTMIGGLGNDTYVVDVLTDVVTENVGEGTDTIRASLNYTLGSNQNIENLTLIGMDAINGTGNEFDNVLTGNSNTNILTGRAGNDTYVVDNVVDVLIENASEGNDTVQTSVTYTLGANLENLTLIGTAAINGTGNELDNMLTGNSNDNILNGGTGVDAMYGGLGNDTYIIQEPCDIIYEYADQGADTVMSSISYSFSSNSITAYLENLTLTGTANINGSGNFMNNVLIGNSGANMLYGNGGNDTLDGGAGADRMVGGDDSDTYIVDNQGDQVIESPGSNAGWDMVKSSVSFTLGSNVEGLTLTGTSSINGTGNDLENHINGNSGNNILTAGNGGSWMDGGAGDDILIGGANCDVMDGGTGADTMIGGLGKDSYKVDNIGDIIVENENEGIDHVQSSISYTLGANVENLGLVGSNAINGTGNALDNELSGNSAANTLTGGAGNDSYIIGDTGDIVVENVNEGIDTVQAYITYSLGSNIENLTLEETGDINGTGNALDNVITGSNRNYYTHLGGNNILIGGAGNDTLTGNSGNDIYIYNRGDGQDIIDDLDLVSGADIMRFGIGIADTDISALRSGNNLVFKIIGSNDHISFIDYYATETVNVDGESLNHKVNSIEFANGAIWDQAMIQTAVDSGANQNLTLTGTTGADTLNGGAGNDTLSGLAGNDTLIGNAGNDYLDGEEGADSMLGGVDNDIYIVDNTGDIVTENANEGTDTVQSVISYILSSNVENLTLTGTSAINGTGNTLNNVLIGNSGANTLSGGTGTDTLFGGQGDDIYIVDNTGDVVTENANEGIDLVRSSVTSTLFDFIENLTLTGSAAINGTGNSLDNMLTGNSAVNTLTGGAGNDTLNGGAGADKMFGGLGNDTYMVDKSTDVVTENADEGTDSVQSKITYTLGSNVENLTLTGTSAIKGTGNTLNNVLVGNSGANTLSGGAGNDTLDGGLGKDILTGGAGNDFFVFDTALSSAANIDKITDFTVGLDKIQLDKEIFTALTEEGALSSAFFRSGTNGVALDENDYFLYNTTSGALLYDADGNGQGVAVQFATLTSKPAVTANDFLVVA